MKRTGLLSVKTGLSLSKGKLVIHPNDGYDLGLMNREYRVGLYINEKIEVFTQGHDPISRGSICLENNCGLGAIEMSLKQWAEMGQPEQVMLVYDNGRLLVLGKDLQ